MAGIGNVLGEAPQAGMTAESETVPDDAGMEQATPEEQAAYEEFVKQGYDLMYGGGEAKPGLLKLLDDDPTDLKAALGEALPADSPIWAEKQHIIVLAAAAVIITLQVVRKWTEENGEKPDGIVIFHGGKEILEDLANLSEVAGVRAYSEEEISEAFRIAADLYREAGAEEGLVDLEGAKQEWGEIEAADKEGRIGDLLPALAAAQPQEEPVDGA